MNEQMPVDDPPPISETVHEMFRRDIEEKNKVICETSASLDRLVVGGAAGTLALSMAFIERIAPHPLFGTRYLLMAGWISLLVSLTGSLFSLSAMQRAFEIGVDRLLISWQTGKHDMSPVKRWNAWVEISGMAAKAFLLIGVSSLVTFAYLNVEFMDR